MSKLKNTFGFTGSLLDAIKAVHEAAKAPGTEAREKITNVPRKAGDEDLRARQGEIQRKIVDEGLKGNQDKIDVAKPKGKITAADFAKLRTMKKEEVESVDEAMKEKEVASSYYKSTPEGKSEARNKSKSAARLSAVADKLKQRYGEPKKTNEEVEELDELSLDTLEKYKRKAGSDIRDRIAKFQTPDRNKKTNKRIGGYRTAWQKIENKYDGKEEVEYDYDIALDEEDKTYPYKASQLTPVMVQLRALIKFLSRSGVLKSLMKEEHHALYEVFMEQEFDANELQNILEEIEDLLEGRPKGSKNKAKGGAPASSEAPKTSTSHDSDD